MEVWMENYNGGGAFALLIAMMAMLTITVRMVVISMASLALELPTK